MNTLYPYWGILVTLACVGMFYFIARIDFGGRFEVGDFFGPVIGCLALALLIATLAFWFSSFECLVSPKLRGCGSVFSVYPWMLFR